MRAIGSQRKIVLVRVHASRRRDDLLGLRIEGRLRDQRLAFDEVWIRTVRVGGNCFIRRCRRRISLAGVEQYRRFVAVEHSGVGRLGLDCVLKRCRGLSQFALLRVSVAHAVPGRGLVSGYRLL